MKLTSLNIYEFIEKHCTC